MSESILSVGVEMILAVLTAAFFVVDCLRQEAAPALRLAVARKRLPESDFRKS